MIVNKKIETEKEQPGGRKRAKGILQKPREENVSRRRKLPTMSNVISSVRRDSEKTTVFYKEVSSMTMIMDWYRLFLTGVDV